MVVGILALQGDFIEHRNIVNILKLESILIKEPSDMKDVDSLILPGGESTSMNIIQKNNSLFSKLKELISSGIPTLGTCAGAILLSKKVINSDMEHLNILDVSIERNAYGRQNESFEAYVSIDESSKDKYCFIRAPKIIEIGDGVKIISKLKKQIVGVRHNNVAAFTFHPELSPNPNYLNWLSAFIKNKD